MTISPVSCPHCGRALPQSRPVAAGPSLAPGHIALCMFCERFSVVTTEYTLRLPNAAEERRIAADPNARRAVELLRGTGGRPDAPGAGGGPKCPSCGAANGDAVDPAGCSVRPSPGAWSICLHCGAFNRYVIGPGALIRRGATETELAALRGAAKARRN